MHSPRSLSRTTFRVATLNCFTLIAALALASGVAHGETPPRGVAGSVGRKVSPRENFRTALGTALPVPTGAELSYQPVRESAAPLPNFEVDPAKADVFAPAPSYFVRFVCFVGYSDCW